MLGLSIEWVRQLIQSGELDGWQEPVGRREWRLTRASVIAYGERRDRGHGPGGSEAQARQAEAQARGVLDPLPAGHRYPIPAGENRANVLRQDHPRIAEFAGWRG